MEASVFTSVEQEKKSPRRIPDVNLSQAFAQTVKDALTAKLETNSCPASWEGP